MREKANRRFVVFAEREVVMYDSFFGIDGDDVYFIMKLFGCIF